MSSVAKLDWTDFKVVFVARNLALQWQQVKNVYWLKAFDGNYSFECVIRITDPANDDQTDFETNWKNKPIKPVDPVNASGKKTVEVVLPVGEPGTTSYSICTPDFSDRTSWYQKSVQVVEETLSTSDNLTYSAVNPWWINIWSPTSKLTYTDFQIPKRDGTYGKHEDWEVIVKVDNVVVPRLDNNYNENFTINYRDGRVTFPTSQAGKTIKATYWHNNGVSRPSEWLLTPQAGKKYTVRHVEMQFSKTTVITNTNRFEVWANPAFTTVVEGIKRSVNVASYSTFPDAYFNAGMGQRRARYRNVRDFINAANEGKGSIPQTSEMGEILVFPFNYVQSFMLDSAKGALFRIWIERDLEFSNCEIATATFYLQVSPTDG